MGRTYCVHPQIFEFHLKYMGAQLLLFLGENVCITLGFQCYCRLSFSSLSSFSEQKFLIFITSNLSVFVLQIVLLVEELKRCQTQGHVIFSDVFCCLLPKRQRLLVFLSKEKLKLKKDQMIVSELRVAEVHPDPDINDPQICALLLSLDSKCTWPANICLVFEREASSLSPFECPTVQLKKIFPFIFPFVKRTHSKKSP